MTPVAAAAGSRASRSAVRRSRCLENAFGCRQVIASQETAPARGALRPDFGVYAGGQPGMVLIVSLQAAGRH